MILGQVPVIGIRCPEYDHDPNFPKKTISGIMPVMPETVLAMSGIVPVKSGI